MSSRALVPLTASSTPCFGPCRTEDGRSFGKTILGQVSLSVFFAGFLSCLIHHFQISLLTCLVGRESSNCSQHTFEIAHAISYGRERKTALTRLRHLTDRIFGEMEKVEKIFVMRGCVLVWWMSSWFGFVVSYLCSLFDSWASSGSSCFYHS